MRQPPPLRIPIPFWPFARGSHIRGGVIQTGDDSRARGQGKVNIFCLGKERESEKDPDRFRRDAAGGRLD